MVVAWSSHPSHQLKFFFWITSVSNFTCQTSVEDRKFQNGKMYGCCYWAGCMDEWLTGMQMWEPQRGMFVHGFTSHLWVSLCCCTLYFQEFFIQSSNQMTCVNVIKLFCWSPIILQCLRIDIMVSMFAYAGVAHPLIDQHIVVLSFGWLLERGTGPCFQWRATASIRNQGTWLLDTYSLANVWEHCGKKDQIIYTLIYQPWTNLWQFFKPFRSSKWF